MKAILVSMGSFLAAAGLIVACSPETMQATTARDDYMEFCVDCHGPEGKGDGVLAQVLTPRPADLTQISDRNDGKFSQSYVMSHIDGYDTPQSGTAMPPFGDLLEGKTVLYDSGDGIATPTPERLVALMEYIASLQDG